MFRKSKAHEEIEESLHTNRREGWVDENDKLTEFETEEKEDGNLQEDQSVEEGDGSELWEVKKEKDEEINEEGEMKEEEEMEEEEDKSKEEEEKSKPDEDKGDSKTRLKEKQVEGNRKGKIWAAISICWGGKINSSFFLSKNFS